MESEIKQNIELTKIHLTGEEKYLIKVNKLLDDALKIIDKQIQIEQIKKDNPEKAKKKRIQKNYYIKKKPEDKMKRGPKQGGWVWTNLKYTLERQVNENGVDKWVKIGDYASYNQMWEAIKVIYPDAPYSCVKYFCQGKNQSKYQLIRVKKYVKSENNLEGAENS